jgi:bis(5'-nucleosidyl)-tetraphosphatase
VRSRSRFAMSTSFPAGRETGRQGLHFCHEAYPGRHYQIRRTASANGSASASCRVEWFSKKMEIKARSAGVVIARQTSDGWRYLLLRAYRYWDFPKGLVEEGEDALAAACREVKEETGIVRLEFVWGYDYRETQPYGAGKVARYYVALVEQAHVNLPISAELGRPEHDEFRWVSYDEGMTLLGDRLRPVLRWGHNVTTRHGL